MKSRIADKTLSNWKIAKEHGDISKILTLAKGFTRLEVSTALRYGYADSNLIKIISDFYSDKSPY